MSIKIYQGLRIQVTDMDKFIKIFDKRCLNHIARQTSKLMDAVKPDRLLKSAEEAKGLRKKLSAKQLLKNEDAQDFFRYCEVAALYIKSMRKNYNWCNPDSWFNAFVYNKHFYIVPGYPTGLNKVKFPKYVEDFAYWNNTDPPSDISYKEWNKRHDLWEKSGAFDIPFSNRLTHDLISKDNISSLILIEKMVRNMDARINGMRPFPASYTAEFRVEKEERNEHNRSKNSKGGNS